MNSADVIDELTERGLLHGQDVAEAYKIAPLLDCILNGNELIAEADQRQADERTMDMFNTQCDLIPFDEQPVWGPIQ